jgi:hypothetical protein
MRDRSSVAASPVIIGEPAIETNLSQSDPYPNASGVVYYDFVVEHAS